MDADAKGLNINGREMRRYFNKNLFPALRKAKEKALDRWDRFSFNNLQVNRKREAEILVIGAVNSKDASGNYDGIYDNEEVGLIQLVQNKMGFQKPKQALDFIIETMYNKRYQLESGGVSFFMNEAEFLNKSTGATVKGYINSGIGSQGEIDGNTCLLYTSTSTRD